MAKRTRRARLKLAKLRAKKQPGGKGRVRKRAAGRHIYRT